MPRTRCFGWVHGVTAALLVAAGCAGETAPRKERPADRAGTQYARVEAGATGQVVDATLAPASGMPARSPIVFP
jgi:hypothetical protein